MPGADTLPGLPHLPTSLHHHTTPPLPPSLLAICSPRYLHPLPLQFSKHTDLFMPGGVGAFPHHLTPAGISLGTPVHATDLTPHLPLLPPPFRVMVGDCSFQWVGAHRTPALLPAARRACRHWVCTRTHALPLRTHACCCLPACTCMRALQIFLFGFFLVVMHLLRHTPAHLSACLFSAHT